MSELKTQEGEAVIGTCNICGRTVATEEDLPKHLAEARRPGSDHGLLIIKPPQRGR